MNGKKGLEKSILWLIAAILTLAVLLMLIGRLSGGFPTLLEGILG
jgi:hypothetical protein